MNPDPVARLAVSRLLTGVMTMTNVYSLLRLHGVSETLARHVTSTARQQQSDWRILWGFCPPGTFR